MNRYFVFSKSAYYGIVGSLPLLAAYELLVLASKQGQVELRNAADVWLRTLLGAFGLSTSQAYLVMLLLMVLAVPLVKDRETKLVPRYFGIMIGEAFLYSLALGFAINVLLEPLLSGFATLFAMSLPAESLPADGGMVALAMPASGGLAQIFGQSLGAGLFEEFLFRVLLLNILLMMTRLFLKETLAAVVSIGVAALLFSIAHYIGALGDSFELHSFLFRWLAGLLFTMLFYWRGFAITAYSHALYDIRVLLFS